MNLPKISIIVPIYDVENYLPKCIDSILEQTFTDFELILVDDGSPDSCGKICDEYASIDNRIRVIHKENGGQSTARNMALDIARGKYIGFVDGDDYIASDMYEQLYNAIIINDSQISVCGRYNVCNNQISPFFTIDTPITMKSKEGIRKLLIYDNMDSAPWDKLFANSLFDKIRFPSGFICEDVAVIYRLLENAERIVHIGKPLYYYLQRQGSTSRSAFSGKSMGVVSYHKQVNDYVLEKYPDLFEEANYFFLSRLIYAAVLCFDNNIETNTIYKDQLIGMLRDNFRIIIGNKYITEKEKIIALCMVLHCYIPLRIIYRQLRRRRKPVNEA